MRNVAISKVPMVQIVLLGFLVVLCRLVILSHFDGSVEQMQEKQSD